ncbi:MAG: AEC family transporter [Anaerolineae bacterium]|nr:AEC family transporter [Anaerolineae bacterium]
MATLVNVVLPVFLIVGVVAVLQKRLRTDVHVLSTLSLILFVPALTFNALVEATFRLEDFGRMALGLALVTFALIGIGEGVARLLRLRRRTRAAFVVSLIMINAGAFGLPVLTFAFGEAALLPGSMMIILFNAFLIPVTTGYLALTQQRSTGNVIQRIARTPVVYSAALGLIVHVADLQVPEAIQKAVALLADAAIPVLLVVLGLQLSQILRERWRNGQMAALAALVVLRLVVAPGLAVLVAGLLGLTGVFRAALIIDCGISTAILAAALVTEFDADGEFATLGTFATTIASLLTVTVWLNWLS